MKLGSSFKKIDKLFRSYWNFCKPRNTLADCLPRFLYQKILQTLRNPTSPINSETNFIIKVF